MPEEVQNLVAPAEPKKQVAQPSATEITTGKKYRPGFRDDGTPYPGVDPVTGERRTVTYNGLREEFGETVGTRLYNLISGTGFGGVMGHKPALSLRSLRDEKAAEGLTDERLQRRVNRREKVMGYLKQAEEGLS